MLTKNDLLQLNFYVEVFLYYYNHPDYSFSFSNDDRIRIALKLTECYFGDLLPDKLESSLEDI